MYYELSIWILKTNHTVVIYGTIFFLLSIWLHNNRQRWATCTCKHFNEKIQRGEACSDQYTNKMNIIYMKLNTYQNRREEQVRADSMDWPQPHARSPENTNTNFLNITQFTGCMIYLGSSKAKQDYGSSQRFRPVEKNKHEIWGSNQG